MELVLFWIFSVLMLVFGAAVVLLRNPVSSAMSLVMSFIFLASLFFLIGAFFIGIIQILVYAGAVMVLFLFIIMLLDLKTETRRKVKIAAFAGAGLVLAGFVSILFEVIGSQPQLAQVPPELAPTGPGGDAAEIGMTLFTKYNMPFQILAVLLLVATIGVVLLSRRELK